MKKLLTSACLFVVTIIAVVSFIAPAIFGQEKKTAKVISSPVESVTTSQADGWRTVQFETNQVTAPDVAVSPDGEWLIFTMLGKLFRLPVKGGEAEQLTFGPYYDNDPAISPDGKLVAFESDRDGSAGNIFVLTLATREIRQLTRENWADRPTWAPDGQSLVYLQLERKSWGPVYSMPRPPALVRQVRLAGGEPESLSALGAVCSAFYLPDGRLSWTMLERDTTSQRVTTRIEPSPPASYVTSRRVTTRIEVRDSNGKVSTMRTLDGIADPVVPSPKADGLYVRSDADARNDVLFAPISGGSERRIFPVSGERAGFAVSANNGTLYLGNLGHLWKVALPGGRREAVPFRAKVTLAIRQPTVAPNWTPVEPGNIRPFRTIQEPRLSPDGSQIVFRSLARLWRQPLKGGQAQRLVVDSDGTERDPAFSPDGRHLAFVRGAQGKEEIQVLEFQSGKTLTVAPPSECGYEYLTWSPNGEVIAATGCDHDVIAINPVGLAVRVLAKASDWEPYPQLSADGKTLYFQAEFPGSKPAIYRLQLEAAAKPEPLLPAIADGINISMRGQWVAHAVPNRPGIQLAPLARSGIEQADARVLSEADGHEFSFTPDGSALLYVAGDKLWREPLGGGTRQEIPIRLELRSPTPPPTLLQRVRLLDFAAGGFGAETSLLIEGGRIRWIGSLKGRALPRGTVTVDAGGRFAIPGLFDMHGHGDGGGGAENIAYGVTSVRNMGGRLERQNAHADRSDFTRDAVPRCFYAGRILEGPQGGRNEDGDDSFVHPTGEDDARMLVRRWKAQGAQFIKLYNRLPWPLQRAAADEAHRIGLPVAAHGITVEQVVKGVTLGFAGLTHWGSGSQFWWSTTGLFYDDALQMFAASGTRWEPTLGRAVAGGDDKSFRDDPERFQRAAGGNTWLPDDTLKGMWAERLRTMRAAYRRGITFLPKL